LNPHFPLGGGDGGGDPVVDVPEVTELQVFVKEH